MVLLLSGSCEGFETYHSRQVDSTIVDQVLSGTSPVLLSMEYGYWAGFHSGEQRPIYEDGLLGLDGVFEAAELLPPEYRDGARNALIRAGPNRGSLIAAIKSLPTGQRAGMGFLLSNMPLHDLLSLRGHDLAEDVSLAYLAWDQSPWGGEIPEETFLDCIIPYACLDEPRDHWRRDFFERFKDRAWRCKTPGEAAVLLNGEIFKEINVTYSATKRHRPNQSPGESVQIGYASCTGLSIILVDACRACGIPARVAGTPELDGGNNHNWAEVWSLGRWHYLGASEPSELDTTWFSAPLRRSAVNATDWRGRVYSASFRRTSQFFPLAWAEGVRVIPGEDVTPFYTAG